MKTTHHGRKRRIIASHEDIVLLYAGERLPDDEPLSASEVPPGCKVRRIFHPPRDVVSTYCNI